MKPNLFNSVQMTRPNRNVFDLSHDVKMSMDMGWLTPIMVQECVPGDKFTIGCEMLMRFQPMIAPVMHRMDATVHYFFVPNRILWEQWEDFITGGDYNSVQPTHPYLTLSDANWQIGGIFDYMGIPQLQSGTSVRINALPFAAYNKIYNEYYRDQNLITELVDECVSGSNVVANYELRRRAWTHDYFTASLPWAQKGPQVEIPVGNLTPSQLPVYLNTIPGNLTTTGNISWQDQTPATQSALQEVVLNTQGNVANGALWADASDSSLAAATINDLRRAFKLQEWLEKNARGGTRYTESNLVHFGVRSSDARLQRPEYITGVKTPVIISEVLNTTGEVAAEGLPQGNMAGHGIAVAKGRYGGYYCEEHGFIIGIMSVMPLPAYQQGLPRFYSREDRFDYYWPEFAHIGEQEVLNRELYVANDGLNDNVFGYVPRYAEYKYTPSRVAGQFRTTLDYWHLGRIFDNRPLLNEDFVNCDPGKRIFAVIDEDPSANALLVQVLNKVRASRLMPKYGSPQF